MKMIRISREEARKLGMNNSCRFGIVSENSMVLGQGRSTATALHNARKYFLANKKDFLGQDGNFDLDKILNDCHIINV